MISWPAVATREPLPSSAAGPTAGPCDATGPVSPSTGPSPHTTTSVEISRVETHRLVDVPWEFAAAEGEGFKSIDHWRDGHVSYYAEQGVEIAKDTLFVCTWFRLTDHA